MGLIPATNLIYSLNLCSLKLVFAALAAGSAASRRIFITSGGTNPQVPHSDQVVCCYRQGEVPVDLPDASVAGLTKHADCFEPAKDFLDPLAELLTDLVAAMPRGTTIDG